MLKIQSNKQGFDLKGSTPIKKCWFLMGKFASFLNWSAALIQAFGINLQVFKIPEWIEAIAAIFFFVSMIYIILSFRELQEANKFGLPKESTKLHIQGIYKISRNPMYFGFYLSFFGATLYTFNPIVLVFMIVSITVHYKITLAEEKFLEKQFKDFYTLYKNRVRRYI